MTIVVSRHVLRAAIIVTAAAALLGAGWWTTQARAGHNPSETVHVCAVNDGSMRMATRCFSRERPLVLVTENGLQAAQTRIATLEGRVAALEAGGGSGTEELEERIAGLEETVETQAETIAGLQGLLAGVTRSNDDFGRDTLRFTGMNLQIVNGFGDPGNGLGNVIIGYNRPRTVATPATTAAHRVGSHYLITGPEQHWTGKGGLLAGMQNTASGEYASVIGGNENIASGFWSSVIGGHKNEASGAWTSILGGDTKTVSHQLRCHPDC